MNAVAMRFGFNLLVVVATTIKRPMQQNHRITDKIRSTNLGNKNKAKNKKIVITNHLKIQLSLKQNTFITRNKTI